MLAFRYSRYQLVFSRRFQIIYKLLLFKIMDLVFRKKKLTRIGFDFRL